MSKNNCNTHKKTAIIGGGAAGLAAAIFIKQNDSAMSVTVFERLERVGKKLLATGNGRCNISNKNCRQTALVGGLSVCAHYFGHDRTFPMYALEKFSNDDLQQWLLELGMPCVYENDKMFPYSLNASTVLDILRLKCENMGARICLNEEIADIAFRNGKFVINGERFDYVIIACGGKAQPKLGSNGSGYELLKKFGHRCSELMPSITQIKTQTELTRSLKGLKFQANVSICRGSKTLRCEYGQLLFTDYGISGPPAFAISRIASQFGSECNIKIDFMPEYDFGGVMGLVNNIMSKPFCRDMTAKDLLIPLMHSRLAQVIIKYSKIPLNTPINQLKPQDIKRICSGIKTFTLKCTGVQGFNAAQVTAGGIMTADFDNVTMQSKLQKGLFAVGEVLDVDGDCGGYNLQWAFSSAKAAAAAITKSGDVK